MRSKIEKKNKFFQWKVKKIIRSLARGGQVELTISGWTMSKFIRIKFFILSCRINKMKLTNIKIMLKILKDKLRFCTFVLASQICQLQNITDLSMKFSVIVKLSSKLTNSQNFMQIGWKGWKLQRFENWIRQKKHWNFIFSKCSYKTMKLFCAHGS